MSPTLDMKVLRIYPCTACFRKAASRMYPWKAWEGLIELLRPK